MGFERCHPAVNFLYFTAVITGMVTFQHPIFLVISFTCSSLYSVRRNGWKALVFNLLLLPLIATFALYYSTHNHFGVTVLDKNFIGNNLTLESLVYGFVLGIAAAGVCIWFSCVYSVFTTDKVVYLFGKVSPPRQACFWRYCFAWYPASKKRQRRSTLPSRESAKASAKGIYISVCETASVFSPC